MVLSSLVTKPFCLRKQKKTKNIQMDLFLKTLLAAQSETHAGIMRVELWEDTLLWWALAKCSIAATDYTAFKAANNVGVDGKGRWHGTSTWLRDDNMCRRTQLVLMLPLYWQTICVFEHFLNKQIDFLATSQHRRVKAARKDLIPLRIPPMTSMFGPEGVKMTSW